MHITKVFPNSPASNAGLLENDYIIGSKEAKIRNAEDIESIISSNGEITLVVYNKADKSVKNFLLECVDGSIGLEIATGVMHRINTN